MGARAGSTRSQHAADALCRSKRLGLRPPQCPVLVRGAWTNSPSAPPPQTPSTLFKRREGWGGGGGGGVGGRGVVVGGGSHSFQDLVGLKLLSVFGGFPFFFFFFFF